jgi:hypothetical protein
VTSFARKRYDDALEASKTFISQQRGASDEYDVFKRTAMSSPQGVIDDARVVTVSQDLLQVYAILVGVMIMYRNVLTCEYLCRLVAAEATDLDVNPITCLVVTSFA